MKRFTKLTAALAVFVLALFTVACSDDEGGSSPQPDVSDDGGGGDMVVDQGEDPVTDPGQDPVTDPGQDPVEDPTVDPTEDPTADATDGGDDTTDGGDDATDGGDDATDGGGDVGDVGDAGDVGGDLADVSDVGVDTGESAIQVTINEFIVTPTGDEAIELYSSEASAQSLDGWTIVFTDAGGPESFTFNNGLSVGASSALNVPTSDFGASGAVITNSGATIQVFNDVGLLVDSVTYGAFGGAPAPIFQWSTARVSDGVSTGDDAVDFNIDPTPTMGAANDVAGVSLGSSDVVLNEIFVNASSETADFIELYNGGGASVDISGWIIVLAGDEYIVPDSTSVDTSSYFVLSEGDFPPFSSMEEDGVIYIHDASGVRLQDVRWTGITTDGSVSYGFLPDGSVDAFTGDMATTGLEELSPTEGTANASGS